MTERDEEGFPVINDDTIGTVFVSDQGVVYICEYIEGLDTYGWRQIGRTDEEG